MVVLDYVFTVLRVLYYVAYPIFYTLSLILQILSIIAAPLLHLGHYFLHACWYPIHWLGKFETLYIYFGIAVLVGIFAGTSLHYASSFMIALFDLESYSDEPRGRTLASYRMQRHAKLQHDPTMKEPWTDSDARAGMVISRENGDIEPDWSSLQSPSKYKLKSGSGPRADSALLEEPIDFERPRSGRGRAKNETIPNTILEEDSTEDDL